MTSSPTRVAARRDFLTWLLAAPALAACSSGEDSLESGSDGRPIYSGEGDEAPADTVEQGSHVCRATKRDATGPYFEAGSPSRVRIAELNEPGIRLLVEGRILGPDCRTPLAGYKIDVWQADSRGTYYSAGTSSYRLRGKITSDAQGRYRLETILPGRYSDAAGWRPAHLHVSVLTPGGGTLLTTQLYFQGDPYLGAGDYCTRARVCNSADPGRILRLADATVAGKLGKQATFDAVLART